MLKNLTFLVALAHPQEFESAGVTLQPRSEGSLLPRATGRREPMTCSQVENQANDFEKSIGNPGNEVVFARALACERGRISGHRRLPVVPHFPSGIVSRACLSRVG